MPLPARRARRTPTRPSSDTASLRGIYLAIAPAAALPPVDPRRRRPVPTPCPPSPAQEPDPCRIMLNPLYDAVSWVLLRFHDFWSIFFHADSGAAWGLSIVGLVVLIRILLIPLFVKQIKAQRGLQALQPQMKAIKKQVQERPAEAVRRDDEALPGDGHQPALVAACRSSSRRRSSSPCSTCCPTSRSGKHGRRHDPGARSTRFHSATIFGAPIYETFTKADTVHVKIVALVMILLMTRLDVHHPAPAHGQEHAARRGQPDGAAAEDPAVRLPGHVRGLRHQLPDRRR